MATDLDKELAKALRGPSFFDRVMSQARNLLEPMGCYFSIPPYQPDDQEWEITFRALGLDEKTIKIFWKIFYKMNKSHDGEVSIIEFLNFFNLDRTTYAAKAFGYCDTVGGGEMDFLEFIVSVWNMCTLSPETLTNFTFDLYDLDDDGELGYDEMETMIKELYGWKWEDSMLAKECLREMMLTSEKYQGAIPQDAFVRFQKHHSMLLFPAFLVQRAVQEGVMGVKFWEAKAKERAKPVKHGEKRFDRRHVQSILRTYKTGSAAAILTHTGDPNEGLRQWMEKKNAPVERDHDAIKAEIARLRGEKLTKIATWRRLKNPKKREAYRQELIKEKKEKAFWDAKREEERLVAEQKAAEDLQDNKIAIVKKIKRGEKLEEEEEFLAQNYDLYNAAIAGSEYARLLALEEKEAGDRRKKVKEKELERIEGIRRRYYDEGDSLSQFDEDEQEIVNLLTENGGVIPSNFAMEDGNADDQEEKEGEAKEAESDNKGDEGEEQEQEQEQENEEEKEGGEQEAKTEIKPVLIGEDGNRNMEIVVAPGNDIVPLPKLDSSITGLLPSITSTSCSNIIILPNNKRIELSATNGRVKRPRRTRSMVEGKWNDRPNPAKVAEKQREEDEAREKLREENNETPGAQSKHSKRSERSAKRAKKKKAKSHTWAKRKAEKKEEKKQMKEARSMMGDARIAPETM